MARLLSLRVDTRQALRHAKRLPAVLCCPGSGLRLVRTAGADQRHHRSARLDRVMPAIPTARCRGCRVAATACALLAGLSQSRVDSRADLHDGRWGSHGASAPLSAVILLSTREHGPAWPNHMGHRWRAILPIRARQRQLLPRYTGRSAALSARGWSMRISRRLWRCCARRLAGQTD